MKYSLPVIAILFLLSGSLWAEDSTKSKGVSYRWLWHACQLSALSSDTANRMKVDVGKGVAPEKIIFSPWGPNKEAIVRSSPDGLITVDWDEGFYARDEKIFPDQPPGSIGITFGWAFNFGNDGSIVIHLANNWERYLESAYHFYALYKISREDPDSPLAPDH